MSACAAAPTRVCHTSLQITCTLIQLSLGVSFTSHPQFLKLKHATLAATGPRGPYAFNRGSNTHVTKCSIALAPYPFPSPLPCNAFRLLLRDDVCRLLRFLHISLHSARLLLKYIYEHSAERCTMDGCHTPASSLELRRAVLFLFFFFSFNV